MSDIAIVHCQWHHQQISLEEMITGSSSAHSSLTVYDESALCSGAFKWVVPNYAKQNIACFLIRILRSLVSAWLYEVMTNHNYFADFQLQHFYQWAWLLYIICDSTCPTHQVVAHTFCSSVWAITMPTNSWSYKEIVPTANCRIQTSQLYNCIC